MNIKGMDKDMRCRGFQFEVGKEYKIETDGKPQSLCSDTVFHYCKSLQQVHRYYDCLDETNRFFEIEVLGEEVTDGEKCGSNHIKIVREIVGNELAVLKGLERGNSGFFNSGDLNSGDLNSGDFNSGDFNSGDLNSGNLNSGDRNSGNGNSGNFNSGNGNSGHRNSGYRNSGNFNSGNFNGGNLNSGDWNSGDLNSGNGNSGHRNSGYRNSGVGNKCNYSVGVFCNEDEKNIRIFNRPSGMSLLEFYNSEYWDAICSAPFDLTEWIDYTDAEKEKDPVKNSAGGYLKTHTYEEAWANWWEALSDKNRRIIQEMPNFDADIFKDITGIDVRGTEGTNE